MVDRVSISANGQAVRNARFCGLPISVGMTPESVVMQVFHRTRTDTPLTTFINPGAIHIARRNPDYVNSLRAFDLILPDGIGIVWGWHLVHGSNLTRLSFDTTSLALPVLREARDEGHRVMLIGGRPGVAEAAARELANILPGLQFCRANHGYHEIGTYVTAVRAERPDLVICGMGAPRQESVLLALREAGALTGPAFTCGGYLDQVWRGWQYYPSVVDQLNVRWLYRLYREPRRLWRRYLLEYPEYAFALGRELKGYSRDLVDGSVHEG